MRDAAPQAAVEARSTASMRCVAELRVPGLSGVVGITQTGLQSTDGLETLLAGFRVCPPAPPPRGSLMHGRLVDRLGGEPHVSTVHQVHA